jgi:hypothetical protein
VALGGVNARNPHPRCQSGKNDKGRQHFSRGLREQMTAALCATVILLSRPLSRHRVAIR